MLVNCEGGAAASAGDKLPDQLAQAFEAAGVRTEILILRVAELDEALGQAVRDKKRVVIAGGDGTVSCAAKHLVGTEVELALLPLGTLNHLARDLGIPTDLESAAKLAVHGQSTYIDVGEVNGQFFVNNASIGLYPSMVRRRDMPQRRALPKWLAALPASWEALSRIRHHRLYVDMGAGEHPLVTSLLFVGNNEYSLEAGSLGRRTTLQAGNLSVYAIGGRRRLALISFALRALVGRIDRLADFVVIGDCREITVRSLGGSIEIALDGEVQRLACPLRFRIVPRSLRVVTPPATEPGV
ncbi:diacylglycerol/lipid kinase family protein [Rhizorhabdus argentea]|uniref:diacylglycerol/lipid kinase family protein n=1 Tax=Rhizorhabdus argentea TaxID=1387174 RepID=UPI0030ED6934